MAYKLELLASSKIHLVFHVSCMKKVVGHNCQVQTTLLELDEEVSIWLQQEVVMNTRECQHSIKEVLIQWKDTSPKDDTWEPMSILQWFPHL